MRESSQRLISLLCGEREVRPPLWEPWFNMHEALQQRYGGSYIAMADDLGHAAVPVGYGNLNARFHHAVPEGAKMWYGGGGLRTMDQLRACPEPDWEAQLQAARPKRDAARDAGLACWYVIPWCFHVVATNMSLEHFALACYDEPDFIREALAWAEQRNRTLIERVVVPLQPDFVLYDGDCP